MFTLDHVGLFSDDPDGLGQRLEELGLLLGPFTPQFNQREDGERIAAGTANRLAILEEGYLEFLTPTSDTPLSRQMRQAIERYRGFHLIAFGSEDARSDHQRLGDNGFDPYPLVHLQREVEENGTSRTARFSVARVPPVAMPEGRIQICQHHTPELVWRQPWSRQPNGWLGLSDVLVCVGDAGEAAQRFSRFCGIDAEKIADGKWLLETGRGRVTLAEPFALASFGIFPLAPPAIVAIAVTASKGAGLINLEPQATAVIEVVQRGARPFWLSGL